MKTFLFSDIVTTVKIETGAGLAITNQRLLITDHYPVTPSR
jgi:hypothetical protein